MDAKLRTKMSREAMQQLNKLPLNDAHMIDIRVRQGGRYRWHEGDFLKHLKTAALACLAELKKEGNALMGAAGYAARPSMTSIPNQIAKSNGLPKLPTLHRGGMNANTALGPAGGGIGGGGMPPGSSGYGMLSGAAGVAKT